LRSVNISAKPWDYWVYCIVMDAIELSLFVSRMESVCDEMGVVLRRTAFSPNIKDRLDFSCALFDRSGELCAQAAHIPVHLGSMAYAMADIVARFDWAEGDAVVLNDPFLGGTHLPDVTVVSPVFVKGDLQAFAVNRAHHANIGSDSPGSMPITHRLEEEGIIISPQYLLRGSKLNTELWQTLKPIHGQTENFHLSGDMAAQVSSVKNGVRRMQALVSQLGIAKFQEGLLELNAYGERVALACIAEIPRGSYVFSDVMDDDGLGNSNIAIHAKLDVGANDISVDFAGTDFQVSGNINCPLPVVAAAVYYAFRCLMPDYAPACAGLFRPIRISAREGTLVNATPPAAVAAGNVETSTRIVDVVLGALEQALPDRIPAASQGSMNNIAMGARQQDNYWDYYETLAGGHGGGPHNDGLSARHSHMTNTLNTPVESLEMHYPIRIRRYGLRDGSGGAGAHRGGDGLVREYEFLKNAQVSLLTERRRHGPWGLKGGEPGQPGRNSLNGKALLGKTAIAVHEGDCLTIETPGGGGWGKPGSK
jgi:N-methylhydantoinase B